MVLQPFRAKINFGKYIPHKRRSGFAAIASVILICGIGLISSTALAGVYFNEARETTMRGFAVQARAAAHSCASIAVLRLKKNSSYNGNENISVDKVVCSIGQTVFNGNARTLYAQATINGVSSRIRVDFSGINTSQFYLNSWTEIPPI